MSADFVEEKNSENFFAVRYEIERSLFCKQSRFQKVEVVETKGHGRMLLNDDLVMLTERDEFVYHDMIVHPALFTHPNPRRVLIIGGGDGGAAREVLRHSQVEKCDMVEIDEVVVEACREFLPVTAVGMKENSRFSLHIDDGVRYMRETPDFYDVIIVDSTDPIGPAAPLFNSEFYRNVYARLNDGGIVVSQAESPFYNSAMQRTMSQVLSELFPIVRYLNFTNLTYPGGYWSFSFASKKWHPIRDFDESRVVNSKLQFRYYNPEVHRGAFALPNFQLENIGAFLKD